jgi:hypothetical protein
VEHVEYLKARQPLFEIEENLWDYRLTRGLIPSRLLKEVFQPPAPSLLSLPAGREDEGMQPVFGSRVLK